MVLPKLPSGIRFTKGPGYKKYTAILPNGHKVHFGDKRYEHFRDQVPAKLGGQLWKKSNHNDPIRRKNYRKRHGALLCADGKKCISKKYSPAWFSYYYLW